jgi:hypothetical protein
MLAYGPGYFDAFRLLGLMAGKILRGARAVRPAHRTASSFSAPPR